MMINDMKNLILGSGLLLLLFSTACGDDDELRLPTIDNLRLCVDINNAQCSGTQSSFAASDPQIHASVQVRDAEGDETVTFQWFIVENGTPTEAAQAVVNLSEAGEDEDFRAFSVLSSSTGAFPTGDFEVKATLSTGDSVAKTFTIN